MQSILNYLYSVFYRKCLFFCVFLFCFVFGSDKPYSVTVICINVQKFTSSEKVKFNNVPNSEMKCQLMTRISVYQNSQSDQITIKI